MTVVQSIRKNITTWLASCAFICGTGYITVFNNNGALSEKEKSNVTTSLTQDGYKNIHYNQADFQMRFLKNASCGLNYSMRATFNATKSGQPVKGVVCKGPFGSIYANVPQSITAG